MPLPPAWPVPSGTVGSSPLILGVTPLVARQFAPQVAAEDADRPVSQNRPEADNGHDDPPNPSRKTLHGVGSPLLEPEPYWRCDGLSRVSKWWQTGAEEPLDVRRQRR